MNRNWGNDISIDPNHLEDEAMDLGVVYDYYSQKQAEAVRDYETAKLEKTIVRSDLLKKAGKDRKMLGITNAGQEMAWVESHPEYKTICKEVIQAKYEADLATAATLTISKKKQGLEMAVSLYLAGYFSTIRPEKEVKKGVSMKTAKASRTGKKTRTQPKRKRSK